MILPLADGLLDRCVELLMNEYVYYSAMAKLQCPSIQSRNETK